MSVEGNVTINGLYVLCVRSVGSMNVEELAEKLTNLVAGVTNEKDARGIIREIRDEVEKAAVNEVGCTLDDSDPRIELYFATKATMFSQILTMAAIKQTYFRSLPWSEYNERRVA
jgi:hypothetical protein